MKTLIAALLLISPEDYYTPAKPVDASVYYGPVPIQEPVADTSSATRPEVILYATPGCRPCNALKKLIEAGALPEFKFDYRADLPDWIEATPTLHYHTPDGWKQFRAHQFATDKVPEEFRKAWAKWQKPKAQLASAKAKPQPVVRYRSGSHWSVNGDWSPSREEVIQHLLSDGIHRGRHSRRQLEGMSWESLMSLHDADHEGRAVARVQVRRRTAYCPTCPNGG